MAVTRQRSHLSEQLAGQVSCSSIVQSYTCLQSPDYNGDDVQQARMSRRRRKILKEIFTTEKTYQHNLFLIDKYFHQPLRVGCLLPEHVVNTLFGNIEQIQCVNRELMEQLETMSVGEAFLRLGPFLKLYSMYAKNHEQALATLIEWEQKDHEFAAFRRSQEDKPAIGGLKFNALLITPVQRVPRYKMLLNDLLQNTQPDDPDYEALEKATAKISEIAKHINEHIRQHENFQKMLAIQKQLTGECAPKILAPGRVLLKEGALRKVPKKGGRSQERMFFLFSDILMYAKLSGGKFYHCCCVLPLQHCQVLRMFGNTQGGGALFKITCKEESLLLYSDNQETVRSWITTLEEAIRKLKQNRQTLRKESSAKRPMRRAAIARERFQELREEKKKIAQVKGETGKRFSHIEDSPESEPKTSVCSPAPSTSRPSSQYFNESSIFLCTPNGLLSPNNSLNTTCLTPKMGREENDENNTPKASESHCFTPKKIDWNSTCLTPPFRSKGSEGGGDTPVDRIKKMIDNSCLTPLRTQRGERGEREGKDSKEGMCNSRWEEVTACLTPRKRMKMMQENKRKERPTISNPIQQSVMIVDMAETDYSTDEYAMNDEDSPVRYKEEDEDEEKEEEEEPFEENEEQEQDPREFDGEPENYGSRQEFISSQEETVNRNTLAGSGMSSISSLTRSLSGSIRRKWQSSSASLRSMASTSSVNSTSSSSSKNKCLIM